MTDRLMAFFVTDCLVASEDQLVKIFEHNGFTLCYKHNFSVTLFSADSENPSLVILDGQFAESSHCHRLRSCGYKGHILARVSDRSCIQGLLHAGADDVCTDDADELYRCAFVTSRSINRLRSHTSASQPSTEHAKRLQSILDAQVDFTSRYSRGGKLTFVNDAICQRYGLTTEELLGQCIIDFVPAEDRSNLAEAVDAIFKDAKPFVSIQKARDSSGQEMWTEWYNIPILNNSGEVVECQGLGRDATQRVQLAEQLKAREELLRLALIASSTIAWSITLDSGNVDLSDNAQQILGFIPRTVEEGLSAVFEEDQERVRVFLSNATKEFHEKAIRVRVVNPQNKIMRWYEIRCSPPKGDVNELCGILFDVTDRVLEKEALSAHGKRFEELANTRSKEVTVLQRRLDVSERFASMGMIAAQVVHELNGPIAGVRNAFYLIKDILDSSHPYFEYVGLIEGELDRVSQTLRQLYILYGPEGQAPSSLNIQGLLEESCKMMRVIFPKKVSSIVLEIAPDLPLLNQPPGSVRQVFYNVLINALKFSPGESAVRVTVCCIDRAINIKVWNGGPTIPVNIQAEIFKPFNRSKVYASEPGLGLGLYISHCLMTEMGGDISIHSSDETGTVVALNFKLDRPKG
jgi:PAS domain S-box-containing protein